MRIARELNTEGIPGRYKSENGWCPATIKRMLKNTKYIGIWAWNKTRGQRDPRTGRRHTLDRPESEWHVLHDEKLRIIDQKLWGAVQKRIVEVDEVFGTGRARRGFSDAQKSHVQTHSRYLLSGFDGLREVRGWDRVGQRQGRGLLRVLCRGQAGLRQRGQGASTSCRGHHRARRCRVAERARASSPHAEGRGGGGAEGGRGYSGGPPRETRDIAAGLLDRLANVAAAPPVPPTVNRWRRGGQGMAGPAPSPADGLPEPSRWYPRPPPSCPPGNA